MKPPAPLALALLLAATALAQTPTFTDPANLRGERVRPHDGRELPVDQGASGLAQLLRKLNTRASILNIVAHPDDEDGGMLTLYSRGLGARVADISLTRGEGGQNAATGDFEDALGLLRTQELLANDRYVGVDQMFGTEVDFGFSKTKEESFAKWTHERVLYDVVRAIRIYRPLVLTATFIGGVTDGHGQHQVSGQIAQEAFLAAGDPKVFPELTAEGILPWQPLKVFARVPMQSISDKGLFDYATGQYSPAKFTNYVTGEVTTTTPSSDVIVHEGTQDPLLAHSSANPSDIKDRAASDPDTPFTYVQFARIGLGLQRSQVGPGVRNAPVGAFDVAYHLYGSRVSPTHDLSSRPDPEGAKRVEGGVERPAVSASATFFDGINTSIEGIADLSAAPFPPLKSVLHDLSQKIGTTVSTFDPTKPSAIAPQLADALKSADSAIQMVREFKLESPNAKENILHELRIKRVQLNDALSLSLGLTLNSTTTTAEAPLGDTLPIHISIHSTADPSVLVKHAAFLVPNNTPEFRNEEITIPQAALSNSFDVDTPEIIDSTARPQRPYFTRENIEVPVYTLNDTALRNAPMPPPSITAFITLNYRDTPLYIGSIVRHENQPVEIVPPVNISLSTHSQMVPVSNPEFTFAVTQTPKDEKDTFVLSAQRGMEPKLIAPSDGGRFLYQARLTDDAMKHSSEISAMPPLLPENRVPLEGYRPVGYGDLPRTNYFTPATDRIVPVDLKLPAKHNIAYLPGTGDDVPQALTSIGLNPTILTIADLTPDHLKQFDTVILGVRTYNAHPDLHGKPTQALLNYARNGGNVLVQYQSIEFTADDAPYPLSLGSNEKVVDEAAPVTLLSKSTPELTTPNVITPADFNGWIEERGHGFLSNWDAHYTALTETHDPGQLPQKGGLITAQIGRGHWTYCAYALYRQLPEAVPGAYRLFLNLLNP